MRVPIALLVVVAMLLPLASTPAADAPRPWARERLERAQRALAHGRLDAALGALDEMRARESTLGASELALMHHTYGYAYAARDRHAEAAAAFEGALAEGALPAGAREHARSNLAQLYVLLGRDDDAIALFRAWFATEADPPAAAHHLLAVAYMRRGRADDALPHARAAIAKRPDAPDAWTQLLLALLVEERRFQEAIPILEALLTRRPTLAHWRQLAALHAELGDHGRALAALEAAHAAGVLAGAQDLGTLARLYLHQGAPSKAARMLERALADGDLTPDATTWRLLADAWLAARDRSRALAPLREAAARAETGTLFVQLAQLHADREEWEPARAALLAASEKGGLTRPNDARLLLDAVSARLAPGEEPR